MSTFNEERSKFENIASQFADAAFPVTIQLDYESSPGLAYRASSKGMSKRELFAAMAMQGMLSFGDEDYSFDHDRIPRFAVKLADALIAELEKEK